MSKILAKINIENYNKADAEDGLFFKNNTLLCLNYQMVPKQHVLKSGTKLCYFNTSFIKHWFKRK